jgi:hypothetical protein
MTDYERGFEQGKADSRKAWVSLTDEEIKEIVHTYPRPMGPINFARAVEQRLKELNA